MTKNEIESLFEYKDGDLFWKVTKGSAAIKGNKAGSKDKNGYLQTKINGKIYKNHRLIWVMHGFCLPEFLDHIDNNPSNNRIENLRPVDKRLNAANSRIRGDNRSGFKGVSFHKQRKKWRASIGINGKCLHLGLYSNVEDAKSAYLEAAFRMFGMYAREA